MNPKTFIAILQGDPSRISLGILKRYDTKAEMLSDVKPTYVLSGITYDIEFGNIVSVINDGVNDNGLYIRTEDDWEFIGTGTIEGVGTRSIFTEIISFLQGITAGTFVSGISGATITNDGSAEFKDAVLRELSFLLKGANFGDFHAGMSGGQIDEYGASELDSLKLRKFLEVPELRYNRLSINIGDKWNPPGGGIIESVDTIDKIITLKLEDGEIGAVAVDDICMGIFHSTVTDENATVDADDSRGNRTFAGFYTCFFRVMEILGTGDNSRFIYELRAACLNYPVQHHPSAAMHFVAKGNFSDAARQTSKYETRTYERYLKGVNTWDEGLANIAAQFGDLSNLTVHNLDMTGYSIFLNNIYMSGTIQQFADMATVMEIDTGGDAFLSFGETLTITCKVKQAYSDITDTVTAWTVTRETDDAIEDAAWNVDHLSFAGVLTLGFSDLGAGVVSTLFSFTATGTKETAHGELLI